MSTPWTKDRWRKASGSEQAEEYLVAAIRVHLLTTPQRRRLDELNLSIEDLLNGRVTGEDQDAIYREFFDAWNATLGWPEFGA